MSLKVENVTTEQIKTNGTETTVGNSLTNDEQALGPNKRDENSPRSHKEEGPDFNLPAKNKNYSYDVTYGCISSEPKHLLFSEQNMDDVLTKLNSLETEKNGTLDNVKPEMDNRIQINNSKKDSETHETNTERVENYEKLDVKDNIKEINEMNESKNEFEISKANANKNENNGKFDVQVMSELEKSIGIYRIEEGIRTPLENTNTNENDGIVDVIVQPEMDNNIKSNLFKKDLEQNNGISLELDNCTLSDSEDELTMYLSTENMNKKDKNEIKSSCKDLNYTNSNNEGNHVDNVTLKSAMDNSETIKHMEVPLSVDHLNEVKNRVRCDKMDFILDSATDILNENMSAKRVTVDMKHNEKNFNEAKQSCTNIDQNTDIDLAVFAEEQNNNHDESQADVITEDDNTDDELVMYLNPPENKTVTGNEQRKRTIILHGQKKKEPQKTGLRPSGIITLNSTIKGTDCNRNITDELQNKDGKQSQFEKQVDLECVQLLNTTSEKQEIIDIDTQKVHPETNFMLETSNVLDSSAQLGASGAFVDKLSPIKQRDVRTFEKMLHFSSEGFSDQIIIQSPTKIKSEPHSSETRINGGNSLVEITIFSPEETVSHEETRDSVLAASSSALKSVKGPAVECTQNFNEEIGQIVSKETIVLSQKSAPSMFEENDTGQKSDFSTIMKKTLGDIKKQRNETKQNKQFSCLKAEGKVAKPCSLGNTVASSVINKTEKKSTSIDVKPPVSERVTGGKFFRKNNKLYIATNVNGKVIEKEFGNPQKKTDVRPNTLKAGNESKVKTRKHVGGMPQTIIEKGTMNLNNKEKMHSSSNKRDENLKSVKVAKAHIEGTFLKKSKYAEVKPQGIMKKSTVIHGRIKTNTLARALTPPIIDLTKDLTTVTSENEISKSEKAFSSTHMSSKSETSVVSRTFDNSDSIDNAKLEVSNVCENKLKSETKTGIILSQQVSERNLNQVITTDAKHSSEEINKEMLIDSESKESADIRSANDLNDKTESKDVKDTTTIRVFRVEQSPKKSDKHVAKFIILQDDGRYHEFENTEIDCGALPSASTITSVAIEQDTRSAALKHGTLSRKGGIVQGSEMITYRDSKVNDSPSSVVDAAVQSDICCCNCKCKAGTPSFAAKDKQAVQSDRTGARLEDTKALAKVKRKLRLTEEVSTDIAEKASNEICVKCAVKREDSFDISSGATSADLVLKLRKQVELMRLIGKNKKKAGCNLAHQPLKRRIQPAGVSRDFETLSKQATILPKRTIRSVDSGLVSEPEQTGVGSETENRIERKDSENLDLPAISRKGVKRKARDILDTSDEDADSFTDNNGKISNEKISNELETTQTINAPKEAKLKANVSSRRERELKQLKIDMKQEIVDEKLENTVKDKNTVQTRLTRQKLRPPENSLPKKENSRTSYGNVAARSHEHSEDKESKNRKQSSKQIKCKEEKSESDIEKNSSVLKKTPVKISELSSEETDKLSSEKKVETKKHKSTCKRELDNLFIDMEVGYKKTRLESSADSLETHAKTSLRQKQHDDHSKDSGAKKRNNKSPECKSNRTEKRVIDESFSPMKSGTLKIIGESFSPIKKGTLRLSDDFIPDITNAMEECLRLIKEKENFGDGNMANIKQEDVKKQDFVSKQSETVLNTIQKSKVKYSVPGHFEIEKQLCELCGKFVTVYYTKTGLLCYVSEKQKVNIDDNEQQLCEACGSIADSGSVKAHYVLQEKNLTMDESRKRRGSKKDSVGSLKRSPKSRIRQIKPNKETNSKKLKVRFTEPKRSPKKDSSPKRRKIKVKSESDTEEKKKRKRAVKQSAGMTRIKDKKHVDVKTDSDFKPSISLDTPKVKDSQSIQPVSMNSEKTVENSTDIQELDSRTTDNKEGKCESHTNNEERKTDAAKKLRKIKDMDKVTAKQLKGGTLKRSRKSRKQCPWYAKSARQYRKFQRYGWKSFLIDDKAFDFHDIVKECEKPNIKQLEKTMHDVLSKTKDPSKAKDTEEKKKKKHKKEKKEDRKRIKMPVILTSPLERPKTFQKFEFSPTGHISSSETETDVEGPFVKIHPTAPLDNKLDCQTITEQQTNFVDLVTDTDTSVMKEFVAVKLDNISHNSKVMELDNISHNGKVMELDNISHNGKVMELDNISHNGKVMELDNISHSGKVMELDNISHNGKVMELDNISHNGKVMELDNISHDNEIDSAHLVDAVQDSSNLVNDIPVTSS